MWKCNNGNFGEHIQQLSICMEFMKFVKQNKFCAVCFWCGKFYIFLVIPLLCVSEKVRHGYILFSKLWVCVCRYSQELSFFIHEVVFFLSAPWVVCLFFLVLFWHMKILRLRDSQLLWVCYAMRFPLFKWNLILVCIFCCYFRGLVGSGS